MTHDLTEEERWVIARRLVEIPAACWSDLVGWAMKGYTIAEDNFGEEARILVPDTTAGGWCAMEAARQGCCYCGKFQTGLEVTDGRA